MGQITVAGVNRLAKIDHMSLVLSCTDGEGEDAWEALVVHPDCNPDAYFSPELPGALAVRPRPARLGRQARHSR